MKKFCCQILAAFCLLGFSAIPGVAQAEENSSLVVGHQSSWHFLGGFSGGGAFQSGSNGGFAGAELSFARLNRGLWFGGYTDAQYDFGSRLFFMTAGPSMGYGFFGADAGVAARFDDGPSFGPQGRLLLTAGIAALFGRYLYWPRVDEHVLQVGLLFKLPFIAPR